MRGFGCAWSRSSHWNGSVESVARPLPGLRPGRRLPVPLFFSLPLRPLFFLAVMDSPTVFMALPIVSESRVSMAFASSSRVFGSWTFPDESFRSWLASSTVLSSFDDSTALTAVFSASVFAFIVSVSLRAFAAVEFSSTALDTSHFMAAGFPASMAFFNESMVLGSFTSFGSSCDAAVVPSASSRDV